LIISTNNGNLITINGISKQRFRIDSNTPESDLTGQLFIPPAISDFDNDGMDDIAVYTLDGRVRTFKGTSSAGNHKMTIWEYIPEDWEKFIANPNELLKGQIANLRKRLYLTKNMQILGVGSLFLCVGTMFLIFVGEQTIAVWVFGIALIMMIASLGISIYEIQISVKALDLHLGDMEHETSAVKKD